MRATISLHEEETLTKLIETTQLITGLTSFRTEVDDIDTTSSLQESYERYKKLLQENEADSPQDDQ